MKLQMFKKKTELLSITKHFTKAVLISACLSTFAYGEQKPNIVFIADTSYSCTIPFSVQFSDNTFALFLGCKYLTWKFENLRFLSCREIMDISESLLLT